MFPGQRRVHLLLTILSAATLVTGAILHVLGMPVLAGWIWIAGASAVLIAAVLDTAAALARKEAGLDLIALISVGGAIALGEYLTASVIAIMFSGGRMLESFAEEKARQEMSALLSKAPRVATRYEGNALVQQPLNEIRPGDRLLVRAGETVPVDGQLLSGVAVLNESALTGEPLPVKHSMGRMLQSGCVNAGDAFDLLAVHTSENSTFTNIIRLVNAAQQSKAPAARLADRYALLFIPLSLGIAGLAWILTGDPHRALAVAVVATPCPLILAVPIAIVCAMSRCARQGVLIKHGGALENMGQARTLFFDKTGTLTGGRARLSAIVTDPAHDAGEVLRLAASLEQISGHVIAQAIVEAARERQLELSLPQDAVEEPGSGISGQVEGRTLKVGSFEYVSAGASRPYWVEHLMQRIGYEGASGVYIAIDGVLSGALLMSDEIRLDTPRALRLLRAAGLERIVMLTGDRRDVAETIGKALNVDSVLAEQTPESKLKHIIGARGRGPVLMVGDGINDAPALAAADVGIAMGARGAAAAAESAQVVMLVDRLDRLAVAVRIAKKTRLIAVQSVVAGMGLSFTAMIVAALGYLPPIAGAVVQEVIDVAVILNALRVLGLEKATGRQKLQAEEVARLKEEHAHLLPIIERLGKLADALADMPPAAIGAELASLNRLLREQLLPHEIKDDTELYPVVADMVGGEDPMGAMSRTHREIYRLSRTVDRLTNSLLRDEPDTASLQELRRTLYALDAILRLHFAQEEEIYHGLTA